MAAKLTSANTDDRKLVRELSKGLLDKYELLILDDIDYVKKSDNERQVLFELITHRYERGSLLIIYNLLLSE